MLPKLINRRESWKLADNCSVSFATSNALFINHAFKLCALLQTKLSEVKLSVA
jgi:hypothetical protein